MIRVAVIPTAGYGTRLYPATKVVPKAFLPVIGPDGIARPAISYLVDEALRARVDEVILVVSPAHLPTFEAYFHTPTDYAEHLPAHLHAEAEHLAAIGERVRFVPQEEPLGFGHAVHAAWDAVGSRPFLMMLGDHLYRSYTRAGCAAQIANAYAAYGTSVIGVVQASEEELPHRGVIGGHWRVPGQMLDVSRMLEKPDVQTAADLLSLDGQYYVAAGVYALDPTVFEVLGRSIASDEREGGEFQMTTALHSIAGAGKLLGVVMQGETLDFGQPHFYLEALARFRKG